MIIAVVLTFIVALTLTLVIRRAQTVPAALWILDRATIVILATAAVSLVVSLVWFGLLPVRDWSPDGPWGFLFPFPFGSVDLSITPMSASVRA